MTVAAIEAVIARVVLVAELHGLLTRYKLIRPVRGARNAQNARESQSRQKQGREQTEP